MVRMPNDFLSDPAWCAKIDAKRRAAVAKSRSTPPETSVIIRKDITLSAYDRLLSLASEFRKVDPGLDGPASIAKVADAQPALYEAYRIERRAGVRHVKPVTKSSALPAKSATFLKIEAAAQRLQTAESMSPAEAIDAVVQRDPALFRQYLEERRQLLKGGR